MNERRIMATMVVLLVLGSIAGCSKASARDVTNTEEIEIENHFGENDVDEMLVMEENSKAFDVEKEVLPDETGQSEEVEAGHIAAELLPRKSVDLIFFMGQSNMSGTGGDASKAPEVSVRAGEEFRAFSDPSMLYPIEEPFGKNENNPNGLADKENGKRGSLVSAFINEYYDLTNRKVIAVSISVGGMAMDLWLNAPCFEDVNARITDTFKYLEENGYRAENTFVLWLQGESDAIHQTDPIVYRQEFETFMTALINNGIDHVFIITPGRMASNKNAYKSIIEIQKIICEEDDYCSLATDCMSEFGTSYMVDDFHYNQDALNIIGRNAAKGVKEYIYLE